MTETHSFSQVEIDVPEDNKPFIIEEDPKTSLLEPKQETHMDFELEKEYEIKKRKWWILDGKAYDFTNFAKNHPGGYSAIMLGRGLDCTELFRTYHLMRTPPESLLKKYEVKLEDNYQFPKSYYSFEEDGFLQTARRRVREYFNREKKSTKGSMWYQISAIVGIFVIMGLIYPSLIMGNIVAALLHGFVKGLLAVTAGHQMSHFALFSKIPLNTIIFRVFSPFVLSTHNIWSTSHVISHHIHTLTPDDLQDNYPLKRIQPALPFMWFHRFQHIYIWIVYLFGLPIWTLADFFATFPTLFTGKHHMLYLPISQRVENLVAISLNVFINMVMPFCFLPFGHAFLVGVCSNVPASLLTVIQIAVNHEVPETQNQVDPKNKTIDWGAHQVLTSHNFGVNSAIALHMSGGLNMQIEHHIFPSVHYSHFKEISAIVQQTCREFNLPYNTSPSIFQALAKHYRLLKANSKS